MPVFLRCILAVVLLAALAAARAETLTGKVVRITDGDTITVLDEQNAQHKIRIAGIDAPERKQAYYEASRQNLARLAFGRVVTVQWRKKDRYRRVVGNLFVDGQDVGLSQVREGYAWWYREYSRDQSPRDRARYEAAELQARSNRRGLWQDPHPLQPQLKRRETRADSDSGLRYSLRG
jgi:endonuclease YncB( thermonuclease family)